MGTDQWEKVIFLNETNFKICGYASWYVRRSLAEPLREAHIQQAPKHPPKKMLWGFFTVFGPGSLIPIKGMMNLDRYKDILANYLLPILSDSDSRAGRVLSAGSRTLPYLNENANFFAQTCITLLDWPGILQT